MTKQEIYRALADGKQLQVEIGLGWKFCDISEQDALHRLYEGLIEHIRIKPAPKMRTIRAEELPAVFWVRNKYTPGDMKLCTGLRGCWITFDNKDYYRIETAMTDYEYSPDRKTWLKFEVEDKQQ